MSLVSFQEMLADAMKRHYAVLMFDVSNSTMMRAAVETAEEAIENGIAKINIYSELTAAWNTAMRDFLNKRDLMTCWFVVACKGAGCCHAEGDA